MATTAYSGLWNGVYNVNHSLSGAESTKIRQLGKLLKSIGGKVFEEKVVTLNGVDVAGTPTASVGYNRVTADSTGPGNGPYGGGTVAGETKSLFNAATSTTTQAAITAAMSYDSGPTYVADKSGNGSKG